MNDKYRNQKQRYIVIPEIQNNKMNRLIAFFLLICPLVVFSQTTGQSGKTRINGQIVSFEIIDGDTLFMMDLTEISFTSPRKFESREDYLLYLKYRRYAAQVYPYALEAMKIYNEQAVLTEGMKNRHRKKHMKQIQRELEENFEEPLKKLNKTQGMILIKMIERELEIPFYELVRELRGGFTATYWSTLGRFNGYRLKEQYTRGDNPILDIVLDDFNINPEKEAAPYMKK